MTDNLVSFAAEDDEPEAPSPSLCPRPWKVLIVDDEEGVHTVTRAALKGIRVSNRPFELIHAYSAEEAKQQFRDHDDIAMCLLDVVMETDNAGLDVTRYVREELKNPFVRIVLRTGQPGQAPEREIITEYDLNGYKEKADLTSTRLYSEVYTMVCAYRDLRALDMTRQALARIIRLTRELASVDSLTEFAQAALDQLSAVTGIEDILCVLALGAEADSLRILAATGTAAGKTGRAAKDVLPPELLQSVQDTLAPQKSGDAGSVHHTTGVETARAGKVLLHLVTSEPLSGTERELVQLFCESISLGLENIWLRGAGAD